MKASPLFTLVILLFLTTAPLVGEELVLKELSASARKNLQLPLENQLTLATKADVEFVENVTPKTRRAVEKFLKPLSDKIVVSAARSVENHLLLWISFPEIADGGIDLIWAIPNEECVGTFLGGYRG
ncbi:MAG: hypothetical protein P1U85_18860 [Verrucomicrobiales bacterium]|nr:hypothetical protein [Verrucomicrobiales bacterium]